MSLNDSFRYTNFITNIKLRQSTYLFSIVFKRLENGII